MAAFDFSRRELWLRQMRTQKRKFQRWMGSPKATLAILLLLYLVCKAPNGVEDTPPSSMSTTSAIQVRQKQSGGGGASVVTPPSRAADEDARGPLAAIVLLAPPRKMGSMWGVDRFCLLRRAVRSVDRHLNAHFGPYPIHILVARDHALDPTRTDGPYTEDDRRAVEAWAPFSSIAWHGIDLYSDEALEPGATRSEILAWRRGERGGTGGRDLGYQSMCRLWSGRLQGMPFLDDYEYYMRMDDDSLLTADLDYDPFVHIQEKNLTYMYRRIAYDFWGIEQLWEVAKPHVLDPSIGSNRDLQRSFLSLSNDGINGLDRHDNLIYNGQQPYNNFHISQVDFWRSPRWRSLMEDMDAHHLFFQHRVGDANVHAMALLMMGDSRSAMAPKFPYAHNSNDMGNNWWGEEWQRECNSPSSGGVGISTPSLDVDRAGRANL